MATLPLGCNSVRLQQLACVPLNLVVKEVEALPDAVRTRVRHTAAARSLRAQELVLPYRVLLVGRSIGWLVGRSVDR